MTVDAAEKEYLGPTFLIDSKKMLYVFNGPENGCFCESAGGLANWPGLNRPLISISARLEAEIAELPGDEKELFLQEYGLAGSQYRRCCRMLPASGADHLYTVKGEEAPGLAVPADDRP